MKHVKKLCTFILAACLTVSAAGCSLKSKANEIVVWSHLSDKETAVISKLGDKWGKDNGYTVKVYSDKGDNKAYIEAVKRGMGPDIEFGIPHSKLEKLHSEGLLDEAPKGLDDMSKFIDTSVGTVTFDNKVYGYPLTIATYALYYNTDKVKDAPKTLEQFIEESKKNGFEYDINNFYFSYSFMAGYGAYVCKNNNGVYNLSDIGLNNQGAIKGYSLLQDFVQKYKFMPANIEGIKSRLDFQNGNTGFYFSGPWDIAEFDSDKSKIKDKYSVCVLPEIDGKVMPAFISVEAAFVSSKSTKKDASWKLLNYLVDTSQKPMFEISGRLPTLKKELNDPEINQNKKLNAFLQQAAISGEAVPNITEMQAISDTAAPFNQLLSGKITPDDFGKAAVKAINDFIFKEKQGSKK